MVGDLGAHERPEEVRKDYKMTYETRKPFIKKRDS